MESKKSGKNLKKVKKNLEAEQKLVSLQSQTGRRGFGEAGFWEELIGILEDKSTKTETKILLRAGQAKEIRKDIQ